MIKKNLEKYVDKLPIPNILSPKSKDYLSSYYEVIMKEVTQKLHRDLPETTIWGYEGMYPGPTIETKRCEKVKVKWLNDLPSQHFLPVDTTVHGADHGAPMVRTVVHLHGGNVPPYSDGYPEAWFTRNFEQVGSGFTTKVYEYPNIQEPTTLFYHDHASGITRLNVYAGLIGFYIIRDEEEKKLNLPKGTYEIPLLIQDKSFNEDGSLFYPTEPDPPAPNDPPRSDNFPNPSIVPEFFGDTNLVNGKVWPYLEVEPRKYRFRIVNGSNSRFYRLDFNLEQIQWFQIGTDGGFLRKPVKLSQLLLAPAERADVIVDFSKCWQQNILLKNDAPTPFPIGESPNDNTSSVMQFRVTIPLSNKDTSEIPKYLNHINFIEEEKSAKIRNLTLIESKDNFNRLLLLLQGKKWGYPVYEKPRLNSVETWNFINLTMDTHPIHIHLIQFQILDRRPFDTQLYKEKGILKFTTPPIKPDLNERGWKDTVRANPGEVTRVIARFGPFSGEYVWHCHILEHEDHEMMRPFKVIHKYNNRYCNK